MGEDEVKFTEFPRRKPRYPLEERCCHHITLGRIMDACAAGDGREHQPFEEPRGSVHRGWKAEEKRFEGSAKLQVLLLQAHGGAICRLRDTTSRDGFSVGAALR